MIEWALATIVIPNWVIFVYWVSLMVAIALVYNFGLRYHDLKLREEIKRRCATKKSEGQQT